MFGTLIEISHRWLPVFAELYDSLVLFMTTKVDVMGGSFMIFELVFGGSVVAYLLVQVVYAFIP